jgi:asparagine synthase (glutamine-hydrolysing)
MAALAGRRHPGGRLARVLASRSGYEGAYEAVRGLVPAPGSGNGHAATRNGLAKHHPQDAVMLLEMAHYLPNQLLRDTDQMSMSHSLEIRVPLLDDEMVNLALSLPAKVRTEKGKALLARAAGLEELNRKQPFALPFAAWFRGPLRTTVREALLSEDLPFAELIPGYQRRNVWEAFESGRTHWSRAWAIAVLRLWPSANGLDWK